MASVKLKFKTDKTLKDGTHPIVIQVIHNRRRKVFYLGYSAKKSQWDKDNNRIKSTHPEHKNIKSRIKNSMRHLNNIIADFENRHQKFSLNDIERKYKLKSSSEKFLDYADKLIKALKESGKKGNAIVYQNCKDSVSSFTRGKDILIEEIDYQFIKKYQKYL